MIRVLITYLFCHVSGLLNAQNGCTDTAAINYDPQATRNNGSCLYHQTRGTVVLKGRLNLIPESSGLVYTDGNLWTFGDSGNPAAIYNIDTANGNVKQTVNIVNYPNIDWEDICADREYIYISDAGNNNGNRTNLWILKIAKSDIGKSQVSSVSAQAISFSYADQTSFASDNNTNFDCEAMVAIGDSLYLFSKDHGDEQTRVYRLSKNPGTYSLTPYTSFNVKGRITGADYNAVTKEIVLIGYLGSKLNSFLWLLSDFHGNFFFSSNKRRIEIGNNVTPWQTEGIAFADTNRLFISCETTPEIPASLYILNKKSFKPDFITGIAHVNTESPIRYFPDPVNESILFTSTLEMKTIQVYEVTGKKLFETTINNTSYTLLLNRFYYSPGIHIIRIITKEKNYLLKVVLIKP